MIKHKKILQLSIVLVLALSFNSCKTAKETSASEITKTEKEMLSNGFHKGTIVDFSTEKGCTFLIKRDDTGELLLPLKLENQFSKANLKVWFKYEYSKRQQGDCPKGTTITLREIELLK